MTEFAAETHARSPRPRPPAAPAYYLGRPASWWAATWSASGQNTSRPAPGPARPGQRRPTSLPPANPKGSH